MEMVRYTHSYSRNIIPTEAMEMLHGSLLMTQDSLDQVETRRGKPCWYLTPQTTPLVAINDANLLVTAIYQLLKTHFKNQPYYVDVTELFQDVCHKATMGQVIDIETRADKTLKQFTMERYKAITKYKTVYHTFQMPVSLALYMADYMNCYMEGDEGFGARSGSDIEDGKCTWLAVVALQRASNQQKIHLQMPRGVVHLFMSLGAPWCRGQCTWLASLEAPQCSELDLMREYKEDKGIQLICNMCVALFLLPPEYVEAVELNTTSALANYATEAGYVLKVVPIVTWNVTARKTQWALV
uniref:Uncharacterized protein n=1 Tax=Timema poppense TaxID=170557 RepID=A0A7R9DHH9_TIMPO|nr:unnamed protein product [Timema poppensis]